MQKSILVPYDKYQRMLKTFNDSTLKETTEQPDDKDAITPSHIKEGRETLETKLPSLQPPPTEDSKTNHVITILPPGIPSSKGGPAPHPRKIGPTRPDQKGRGHKRPVTRKKWISL